MRKITRKPLFLGIFHPFSPISRSKNLLLTQVLGIAYIIKNDK